MPVMLDPNHLYQSAARVGKLRRELRLPRTADGAPLLLAILKDARAIANANGTLAAEVAAFDTLITTFSTPSQLDKIVETYAPT